MGLDTRIPLSYTIRKSAERRIRDERGNASLGVGSPDGSFVTDRQFVASAGPPARQHRASVLGFHSRPEAVSLGALSIVRLKCAFGHVVESKPAERSAYGVDPQYSIGLADFFVALDLAVPDVDYPVGVHGDVVFVRYQDNRIALSVQTFEQAHDFVAGHRVERAGGLVGQQD